MKKAVVIAGTFLLTMPAHASGTAEDMAKQNVACSAILAKASTEATAIGDRDQAARLEEGARYHGGTMLAARMSEAQKEEILAYLESPRFTDGFRQKYAKRCMAELEFMERNGNWSNPES